MMSVPMNPSHKVFLVWAVSVVVIGPYARADQPTVSADSTATVAAVALAPIPLEEVSTLAESASDNMRDIDADLSSDSIAATDKRELPVFIREINARLEEGAKLTRSNPSLDTLHDLEKNLVKFTETLDD